VIGKLQIGLLSDINLRDHPNLAALLTQSESVDALMKLSPEQILIRWVNFHLSQSPCQRQVSNFTADIKDSVVYIHLLHQIAPKDAGVSTEAENVCRSTVKLLKVIVRSICINPLLTLTVAIWVQL